MNEPDILIRPVTANDRAAIVALFEGLSAHDRTMRFLRAIPVYRAPMLDLLAQPDDADHVVVAAFDEAGACVGVARCVRHRNRPRNGEVAFTVDHTRRRAGVARRLVERVLARARAVGIVSVDVLIDPANIAALRLAKSLGFTLTPEWGEVTGSLALFDDVTNAVSPLDELGTSLKAST